MSVSSATLGETTGVIFMLTYDKEFSQDHARTHEAPWKYIPTTGIGLMLKKLPSNGHFP
jgi:hypothetical protein